MTKGELEKEAEVFSYKLYHSKAWNPSEDMLVKAYLAGAEPREKQIAELSKHIVELQSDKGELIDRCRELEAQIEKMRNCGNCNGIIEGGMRSKKCKSCIDNKDLPRWEISEK